MSEYSPEQVRKVIAGLARGRPQHRPMRDDEWLQITDPEKWEQDRKYQQGEIMIAVMVDLADAMREQQSQQQQPREKTGGTQHAERTRTPNPRGGVLVDVARRTNTDQG